VDSSPSVLSLICVLFNEESAAVIRFPTLLPLRSDTDDRVFSSARAAFLANDVATRVDSRKAAISCSSV
jgi:hypothetical protein